MAAETPSAAAQAQSPRTDDKAATQGGTPGRNEKESRKQYEPSVGVFKLALEEAVPVQLKCTHSIIVNNPDSQVSSMAKGFMQRTLTAFASSMQQFSFFRLRSRWHRVELGSEPTKLLNQLADYGLSPDHVPQRFGGTAQPRLFLEHRLKLEKERYAPLFQAKVAVAAVANVAVLTNPDECRPSGIDDPLNPIGQKESAVKNQAVASERSVMDDAGVSINPKTSINITSTTTLPKVTKRKRDVMSQWGEDFASRCTISLFGKPNDEIVASSDTSGENDDSKLYSSDTKHLDTATPSHSADVSSNKTDSLVRERVERLVELTEEFEAKRKVAKLSTERDGIEREQKLLDAHLTICQHIARVYEMDHEVIRSILYEVLSPFIPQDDSLDAFVTDVLNHALIFQGRNCLTGRFMLKLNKATPKMTLSEHHWQILGKAQQSLEGVVPSELPDLRNLTKDIVSDNSPGITSAVAVLPGTSAKSIETTKSEEQQLFKEANALTEADQDEKNLSELQGRADRLAQANQKLSSHQKYLESCIIYANHAIEQFQHHQRQRRDILAAAISLIFSSCIFMSGPLAVPSNHFLIKGTRYDPFLVADRLSSKLAWHSGQNPSSVSIVSLTSLLVSEGYVLHSQVERFVAHWQQQDLQTIKNSIIQPVPRYTSEHEKTKQGDLEERTRSGAEQKSTNHSCNGPEERQQRVQRRRKTSLKRL
uniref:Uncharacterized protein n=1 Tax=Entomoneis paludosa TaxID=265537 RepID=A0A7S2YEP4_9STRA